MDLGDGTSSRYTRTHTHTRIHLGKLEEVKKPTLRIRLPNGFGRRDFSCACVCLCVLLYSLPLVVMVVALSNILKRKEISMKDIPFSIYFQRYKCWNALPLSAAHQCSLSLANFSLQDWMHEFKINFIKQLEGLLHCTLPRHRIRIAIFHLNKESSWFGCFVRWTQNLFRC